MKTQTGRGLSAPTVAAVGGFLLVGCAITLSSGHFFAFFSLEGIMVVVGGVLAVASMSYRAEDVRAALDAVMDMFHETKEHDLRQDLAAILGWAQAVRVRGMRGLELDMRRGGGGDAFVKYGLNMAISNYTPDEVRGMMETAADAERERAAVPAEILHSMASHAPAFGMIGTLIGMVTMLCSLGGDVSGIGASLAVSFLSTLYGVVSARMVYMPAAARLMQKVEAAHFRRRLLTEGMVMLAANRSPLYIRDRLAGFLAPGLADAPAFRPQLETVNA